MRAFVSHNHKDKPAVRSFATKLRLGGVSREFWDLVKFMDALQYA